MIFFSLEVLFTVLLMVNISKLIVKFQMFQLSNTKTTDNRQTLMHFLVEIVQKQFPDIIDFSDELIHVEKAVRGTSIAQHGDRNYCVKLERLSRDTLGRTRYDYQET